MPKRVAKTLDVEKIEDEKGNKPFAGGAVVAKKAERTLMHETEIVLEGFNGKKLETSIFNDSGVTVVVFGSLAVKNVTFINDYFAGEGFMNGIGGLRASWYPITESGVHFKHTWEALKELSNVNFGYIRWDLASADVLSKLARRGLHAPTDADILAHSERADGNYQEIDVAAKGKLVYGHWVNPEKLEDIAKRLGKTVATLSPVTKNNHAEAWNKLHKHAGIDILLDVLAGKTRVEMSMRKLGASEGWKLSQWMRRYGHITGKLEDCVAALRASAKNGQAQLNADQSGFVAKSDPTFVAGEVPADFAVVDTNGKTYTAEQLFHARIQTKRGDLNMGILFMRDVDMVVREWTNKPADFSWEVVRLAQSA